jgi:hypothetical protein
MKKNEKSIELFSTVSPEDLKQRLLKIGVEEKFIKNHWVKYFYIIHKIYSNDVINKNEKECRLHSDLLRKLLGSYYSVILNHLISTGIIQLSSNYLAGGRSNGYILVEDRGASIYEFGNEHNFVRKMLKEDKPRVQKDTQTLSRLFRALSNLEYDHLDQASMSESEKKFIYFLKNNLFQLIGERGNRVYNNFSNLPKSIRSKVRLNGEELVFVDIVNSQMVFLASVIKKTLEFKNKTIENSTSKFIDLATTGKLYEYLMKECEVADRAELKDQVFKIIFGPKSFSKLISKKFNQLFPQVIEEIKFLKKDDHHILAHQMQQMEARVVFRALDSIDYEKDILTVHDSLYAPESEEKTILEALINSFKEEGLEAVINVNDKYTIKVSEFDSYSNQIDRILENTSKMDEVTEYGPIMVDLGAGEFDAMEDQMMYIKHWSIEEINKSLAFYKIEEKVTSKNDIDLIRKLAHRKALELAETANSDYSNVDLDDDFDDFIF